MQKQTALQRKIFTRWVNQKLVPNKLEPIKDCVEDFADGHRLIELLQLLSEQEFKGKHSPQTMRMKQIEQADRALKFCFDQCNVDMKLKPSAENLTDKDERNILALLWGIMLKFLKFGDEDEEKLSAQEALLMWVRNQVAVKGIEVKSFKKAFHSGLTLAAVMDKFRPKIMKYEELAGSSPAEVWQKTFAAAEHCFGLEQYLDVEDIEVLDEKSMLIYVSDYYMGAAAMRKVDLAVRRITKLVQYTELNDGLRADYNATAGPLRERVDGVLQRLNEHVIDNTMQGAKDKLAAFEQYKVAEKGINISDNLKIENLFINLSLRLQQHGRPAFIPTAGLRPSDFAATMAEIETAEKTKSAALLAELNRQIRLANIYSQHKPTSEKLAAWTDDKLAYLATKEECDTSNVAKFHLNRLLAYNSECANTKSVQWVGLQAQGAELVNEKFEFSADVQAAEASISANLSAMDAACATKQAVLDDDLARNLYSEKITAVAEQGAAQFKQLKEWVEQKLEYTAKKEDITCVADAQLQLSLLAAYESNKGDLSSTRVPAIKALNAEVLSAAYKTGLSEWLYPKQDEVRESEKYMDDSWVTLATNSAQKKAVLEDDLAREQFKEEVRLLNLEHVDRHATLEAWVGKSEAYVDVREAIDNIEKAQSALDVLTAFGKDKEDMSKTAVASLNALGSKITTAAYKTELSEWQSPDIPAVQAREQFINDKMEVLGAKAGDKKAFLDAELARELKKEELRLKIAGQGGDFMLWGAMQGAVVKASHFGFVLEEVQAFGDVLAKSDGEIGSEGTSKLAAYHATFEEAKHIGVEDNRYTTLVPDDLVKELASLTAAVAQRKADYDTELARQQANDALDLEFSALVDGLHATIDAHRNQIKDSGAAKLEEQEAFVKERLESKAESDQLPKVKELDAKIKEAAFSVRHTTLSALDTDIAWDNYSKFLAAKAAALKEQILHEQLRGVSPDEYDEIQAQFEQFDKNSNGTLDVNEFKACLYSLGEEMPKKEVSEVIAKFGDGSIIPYEGFKEFMIQQLGDTDTKEEIVEGFQLMHKGAATADEVTMMELFKDATVEWIKKERSDMDYVAFSEQVFAR